MDAERKERKRITDRESQRAARKRQREKLSHLENLVNDLTQGASSEDRTAFLTEKILKQEQEIASLKSLLASISKASSQASASIETKSEANIVADRSLRIASYDGDDRSPSLKSSKSDEAQSVPISDQTSDFFGRDLGCDSSDQNYYAILNAVLRDVEHSPPQFFHLKDSPEAEEDADGVIIHCILYGWPAVQQRYSLDIGWHLLRALDSSVFYRAGRIERAASLKILRAMILV